MRKTIYILLLLIASTATIAQTETMEERSSVCLDRNLFISGEFIHFSVVLYHSNTQVKPLSKIIYIELITPQGEQIKGQKYNLTEGFLSESIQIPETTLSGNYYLRAYTKSMRNFGPQHYSYAYFKVVNPDNQDLLNGFHEETKKDAKLNDISYAENYFNIKLSKSHFNTREKVKVEIENTNDLSFKNISIAVIPESTFINKELIFTESSDFEFLFYPESRGITLSGIVRNKKSKDLLSNHKVNLSILDQNNNNSFYPVLLDSSGRFFFNLPKLYENKDVFISVNSENIQEAEILINNDFCTKKINLPRAEFSLTKEEKDIAYQLAVNKSVEEYFQEKNERDSSGDMMMKKDTVPFYGKANRTLRIDNYIDLPLIEDYFTELPYPVKLKKVNGERKIIILGKQPEMQIYAPLIMVDYVPVYNHENILRLNPDKVDRIELVTEPFVRGEVTYGGIANFISVQNDFAGIDLPKSGLFLNYQFLTKKQESSLFTPKSNEIPDARNTLYWNPNFKLNSKSKAEIVFITADTKTSYLLKIEAITPNGKKYLTSKKIIID